MPKTMEQPDLFPPEELKRSKFVEPILPQPAKIVEMADLTKSKQPEVKSEEDEPECQHCGNPRSLGKCRWCLSYKK